MRTESEMARRADEENRLLRAEVQAMWQHMQRVEPSGPQVFGSLTNQLAHEHSQPPNAHPGVLPQLSQSQWPGPAPAPPASTAMQGVEIPIGPATQEFYEVAMP